MNESLLVQWTMTRLKTYFSFYRTYNTTCIQDDHRVNTEVEISEQIVDASCARSPSIRSRNWLICAAAEVTDLRIGKRLVARCPVGRLDEKATARGRGRHLLAHVVVETFYFHIPMKTLFSLLLNFPKKVIIQTTFWALVTHEKMNRFRDPLLQDRQRKLVLSWVPQKTAMI